MGSFTPIEGEGGGSCSHTEGGGGGTSSFYTVACSFSHVEGGGGLKKYPQKISTRGGGTKSFTLS